MSCSVDLQTHDFKAKHCLVSSAECLFAIKGKIFDCGKEKRLSGKEKNILDIIYFPFFILDLVSAI